MADSFWKLKKDSTFNTELKCAKILYHSNLNVVLVITKHGEVLVFDGTSGTELHKSKLSVSPKDTFLDGVYVGVHNKLVMTNGLTIGMRSDYNGILLFDTILQSTVQKPYDLVEIELPLFEALLIYQALKQVELPTAESVIDLTNKLEVQIAQNGSNPNRGAKAEKWDTIRLKSTHNSLKWVASTMASELRRQNRYIPALSIASSINERLNCLLPSAFNNTTSDRALMFSEANRRETFTKWPHMDYKWALPDQMAQAGFYHQPNTIGDDRAMCFTCVVCLVCWEPTDEPWSEHERHAPTCPFVRGEYTQNVPLSVNYATAPAISLTDHICFGSSALTSILPTFSKKGLITLYNVSRFIKMIAEFNVPFILSECFLQSPSQSMFPDAWQQRGVKSCLEMSLSKTITENLSRSNNLFTVTACSILSASLYINYISGYDDYVAKSGCSFKSDTPHPNSSVRIRPCVIVAVQRVHQQETASAWNDQNTTDETTNTVPEGNQAMDTKYQLSIAIFDFHYKEVDDNDACSNNDIAVNERAASSNKLSSSKKGGTGTGTAISRNKDCEYYSTKIYEATTTMLEDIGLMETESTSPNHTISVNNSLQSSASFMFPPLEAVQMTSTGNINLTEPMDSILSSTNSTGTISPSEEKVRDPKDGECGDDSGKSDGSKDVLAKTDSIDFDKEVTLVRYFPVLDNCSSHLEISGLYPVLDGQHVLVVIKNNEEDETNSSTESEDKIGGMLLLYRVSFKNSVLSLEESYVAKRLLKSVDDEPKEFIMLPTFLKQDESYLPNSHLPMGILLTASGKLHLINLKNLETVSVLLDESSKFVSIVYCDLLEKLCACDENGRLHYISVFNKNAIFEQPYFDQGNSLLNENKNSQNFPVPFSKTSITSLDGLKTLLRLTHFENVTPCYLANVPSSWHEVKQAQKQRRHPQLLQQSDSEQHTRSWKLQVGERTWDEHIFELTLMQNMCIGHVDVKFSLHPSCQLVPNVQVTLLRLKNDGKVELMHAEAAHGESSAANTVSADMFNNPVTTEEFHLKHNTEVLCGPVNLVKYLDLSKRAGTITLTSPKLFRNCCRTLLLHVKALGGITQETTGADAKSSAEVPSQECKKKTPSDQGSKQYSKFYSSLFVPEEPSIKKEQAATVTSSKKPSAGCDWIHELSITIRKPKRVELSDEKLMRCYMLESLDFVTNLLNAFCDNRDPEYRLIALDILIWVASIRMSRFRSVDQDVSMQQMDFAQIIEHKIPELIKYGFIEGSRELAHKVTKLLVACSMGCKDVQDTDIVKFDFQLLKVLIDWIPRTLQCWSAGAFRWFFQLLLYVLPQDRNHFTNASQKCLSLLNQVAKELHSRRNPYHLLLRTRYGLYGNPFESELFDTEPIIPGRSSSVPVTYANLVAGPNIVFSSTPGNESTMNGLFSLLKPMNSKELAAKGVSQKFLSNSLNNSKTDLSFLTGISASHYMKGLLEVEPLHFTCHATSDGTRVERVDSDIMDEEAIVNYYGPTSANAPFQTATAFSPYQSGKKPEKVPVYIFKDLNDISQTPLETVLSEEAFQHFKMSVIPKIKQSKNLEVGKPLIVIDNPVPGPSYVPTPIYHDKVTYSEVHSGFSDSSLSWQQLLVPPPQQVIIIDRMHSGAKRFVVLDFGFPICLTDMLVPSCPELLSLSIDIWTQSEEADGKRLVVASDIGSKMLIMSDIQPPPICRYLKITAIGRYGMSTTKCRIPIGTFYGHSYVLPSDGYAEENAYFRTNSDVNVQMLSGMMEDVQCRYGLVCSKLRDLLTPLLSSEIPNVDHMNHYLNKGKTKSPTELESHRVNSLYKDCITFQHQMNVIRNVMNRMSHSYSESATVTDLNFLLSNACTDKLRNLTEALLDLLLYIVFDSGSQTPPPLYTMLSTEICQDVFSWLCVGEDSRTQVSTCTLLVRLYGAQPGWGEFLMNTFTKLYSSNYHAVFPQDRVFVLLSYLGRKSILSGGNQNYVIEHILKALLNEFLPLTDTTIQGFIRGKLDLPLLSWLLMFFLQCVEVLPSSKTFSPDDGDHIEKDNDAIRWNFIQSEVPVHRKRMMIDKKGWSRHFRRAIQKKVMQSKQQLKDLEAAKKNFQVTTQALGKLSNHTLKLKQELQNVLKSIPISSVGSSPKLSIKAKAVKDKIPASNAGSSSSSWVDKPSRSSDNVIVPPLTPAKIGVDKAHCLPVTRALVAFMLHVDITCNVDLFLISCKVMSCLLQISNVPIALNEILNEDQLVKLLQMAVWCENGQSMCGGKWTSHAIICLLQDIMDKTPKTRFIVRARRKSSTPLEGSSSGATEFSDMTAMEADATDSFTLFVNNTNNISTDENSKDFLLMCSSTPKCDNSQLPSLMESDDSEVDENLEEYLLDERGTKELSVKNKNNLLPNVSVALDSRLEYGVEENIEVFLRTLADKSSCNLLQSVNAMLTTCCSNQSNSNLFKMDHPAFLWAPPSGNTVPSMSQMFSSAFDRLFTNFNVVGSNNNLEETLSLWLLLINKNNTEYDSFSNIVPLIPISVNTISNIMTAACRRSPLSIRLWFLIFKTLTYASNIPPEERKSNRNVASSSSSGIENPSSSKTNVTVPEIIIQHELFSSLLSEFLSCPYVDDMAGENVVRAFSAMLHRLADHIRANPTFEELGMLLKERLLEVLCTLLSGTGAIVCRRGPLDAQIAFLMLLQECEFIDVGFSLATDIIIKLGDLVLPYVQYMNSIKCCTSSEIPSNAASCFAPPALKSASSAQNADGRRVGPFSRDFLVMQLLRFASKLLKLSSESAFGKSDLIIHCSRTDDSKVVEQIRSANGTSLITKSLLADVVLRHRSKMYQFLSGLNSCYRSSLCEVTDWHVMPPLKSLNNHSTVADGIFHFLNTIFTRSTDHRQKISIFCGYLSSCTNSYAASGDASLQLSDPMFWLLTKILNDPDMTRYFIEKGGVEIVRANLQRCFSVILNQHSSTVSLVMQYMYGPHGFNVPATAIKGKKKHTVDRNEDGLINFAPLGTIVLDNPAAQPADVLLMSATPHRRARSAAWSYHFYPEEKSVDLKILLPCAILLKEVHLQPHHMSLATSPKAVSLEISRGGGEYIPIQAPVQTSGLAFLHMTLYQPEVVTSVLIRCYKPKEASGIGLSQIRLLGYSAFGDKTWRNTYNDIPNDHQLMNSATAWLRLYHHILTISRDAPDVEYQILDTLAISSDTVHCICGLLLLPSPLPTQFNRVLTNIILKLGLHSKELCLDIIKIALRNGVNKNYKCGKPVDPATTNSVFELLHQLCCSMDEHAADRVTMMLDWLAEVADISMKSDNHEHPIPTYVYCISCILWASQENQVNYDLSALLTPALFSLLLEWSAKLSASSALKRAVDRVLCSMYVIKPENYITLLENMSIILNVSSSLNDGNVSDDLKEKQHHFTHIKQPFMELSSTMLLVSSKYLFLSEKMFTTLSTISQSHISAQQLIGCGFLALLVDVVIEFCKSNKLKEKYMDTIETPLTDNDKANQNPERSTADDRLPVLHIDTISNILQFFSELCWEGSIRTWLGSSEISIFWEELLHFLCKTVPTMHTFRNDLPSESLLRLEDSTIQFFSRCCWCYPKNQKTLAHIVYKVIDGTSRRYSKYNLGITDFTRRVLLQLILETEKIFILVENNLPEGSDKSNTNSSILFPPPAAYPSSSRHQLLYLNTSHTCVDIINKVLEGNDASELGSGETKTVDVEEEVGAGDEVLGELCDKITLAAGVTAKDKRLKDALTDSLREESIKRIKKVLDKGGSGSAPKLTLWVPTEAKYVNVCQELTISQMLQLLVDKGDTLETPIIKFMLLEQREEAISDESKFKNVLEEFGYSELPSVLKEFVDTRGLEMVAHRLPMVYPIHYLRMVSSAYDGPICRDSDQKWVKLDVNDDIYEEVMEDKGANATISMGVHPEKRVFHTNENLTVSSVIPPHSLIAFGQFLKLPNYAEWLIRDRKQAQCLLRLVLGGSDEADFNIASDPAKSLILNSLPTLPFEILRYLFKSTPLSSDEGMELRMSALKHGAINVVLACLAIFTHQPEIIPVTDTSNQHMPLLMALKQSCSSVSNKKSEDKSHQYWAKGTGFGTGSTTQSWNVEQALCRQRFEEEHVTIFLQILACYINPDLKLQDKPLNYFFEELMVLDQDSNQAEQPQLPSSFVELLEHSCLLTALASYLRNDSVLDMARHIPLYRAILMLMRIMAVHPQTVTFLLPPEYSARQMPASSSTEPIVVNDQSISLVELLQKMKTCVDTYISRLKKSKETEDNQDSISLKTEDEDESGEGLATLIPDIRATAKIVETITEKIISKTNAMIGRRAFQSVNNTASVEEVYLRVMKKLQFDTYDMIVEDAEGLGYMFNVSYHFEPNVHSDGEKHIPARMKRLAQEAVTLTTSLPLSYSSSVFVRCDTDRLDVMKVLITGPAETPYANGCFEFDVYFPPDYPNSPMLINLETTGRHSVRFNPNLYNDGKVCLSVLNTWHGRPEEKWNAQTSSFLQVLVSIQSLILVPEPYFNEPGYERSRGTASGNQSSREYNANIMQATVRWAMLDQIRNPSPCFKDIIHTHFWLKRNEITKQILNWINEVENEVSENSKANRTLSHGTMSLKCHYKMLCDEFANLTPPPGLEDVSKNSQFDYKPPSSPTPSTSLPTTIPILSEPAPAASDDDSEESFGMPKFNDMDKWGVELD